MPIAHANLSLNEVRAVMSIDGSAPKVGAAHGERSSGRVYGNVLFAHMLELARREAKSASGLV